METKSLKEQLHEDHPKDPKHFWLWLVLLILIIIGGAAWAGWQNKKTKEQKNGKTSSEIQENKVDLSGDVLLKDVEDSPSTSLGTTGDIAAWQTYRNEEFGFEFRYPKEGSINDENSVLPQSLSSHLIWFSLPEYEDYISFEVFSNDDNLSAKNWYEQILRGNEFSGSFGSEYNPDIDEYANVKVGNAEGFQVRTDIFGNPYLRTFVTNNGNVVRFLVLESEDELCPSFAPMVLNQILSTFKFID